MRLFKILLLILASGFLISCTTETDGEAFGHLQLFRHRNPAAAMERVSAALRSGSVLIRDRQGYSKVFDTDSFRFREANIRPMELSFIPGTEDFTCAALVMDSRTNAEQYDVVFFACSMNPALPPALVGTERVQAEKNAPPPILPEPSALAAVCYAMLSKIHSGVLSWVS